MPQAVALLIALTSLAPATTQAQFGGLAKKAAQKAAERAVEKKVDPKVDEKAGNDADARNRARPPSAFTMTDSIYIDFARGLKAELALLNESESYDRQAALHGLCRDSTTRQARLKSKNLSAAEEKKLEALDERYSAAIHKANNDDAALKKAKADHDREFNALYGIDVRADSVAVAKNCPANPREPAWITEAKAKGFPDDQRGVRAFYQAIVSAGVKASRMTPHDYAGVKEFVTEWYTSHPSGDAKSGVLEAHRDEIVALRKVLDIPRF
jgi:hypothetical protein